MSVKRRKPGVAEMVREFQEALSDTELVNRIARQLAGDYDWRGVISVMEKSGLGAQVNQEMIRLGYQLRCREEPIQSRYSDDEPESYYHPTGSTQ